VDPASKKGRDTMGRLVPLDWKGRKYIVANTFEDAKILKESTTAAKGLDRTASQLEGLINKYGNEVSTRFYQTKVAGQMETLFVDLMFKVKEATKAGALDKGMVEVVDRYIGDPSKLSLNPKVAAQKLATVRKLVQADWEDQVGGRAESGDFRGWFPRTTVNVGDQDVGLSRDEAEVKLKKGAEPQHRAEAVSDIVTKYGGSFLDEGEEFQEPGVADAIRAGAYSDQERNQGVRLLEEQLEVEKDPAVKARIRRGIQSLKRSQTKTKITRDSQDRGLDVGGKVRDAQRETGVDLEVVGDPLDLPGVD
jgi:hypothetical protein